MVATAIAATPRVGTRSGIARSIVRALTASRVRAAARELHRHEPFVHETALVHGNLRAISLSEADVLPFNG
jgi:hypothetical protein